MAIADRVAVMSNGVIVECAHPSEIYDQPASRFAAQFVGSRNAIELTVDGDRQVSWDRVFRIPAPEGANGSVLAVFRPEDVRRAESGGVEAVVDVAIFLGAVTRVYALCGGERIAIDLPTRDAADLTAGKKFTLAIEPSSVRLYCS